MRTSFKRLDVRPTAFILPMMLISVFAFAGKTMSVEEAIRKKLVSASISGKGGYTGEVIRIKLKNLLNRPVSIEVEAGRRLDSENSAAGYPDN